MIDFYNPSKLPSRSEIEARLDLDPDSISWSSSLVPRALAGRTHRVPRRRRGRPASYRPFCRQALYFDPSPEPPRLARTAATSRRRTTRTSASTPSARGSDSPFAVLQTDALPDLAMWGSSNGQFFPRWTYEKASEGDQDSLLDVDPGDRVDEWGYRRVDNITDGILALYRDRVRRAGDQGRHLLLRVRGAALRAVPHHVRGGPEADAAPDPAGRVRVRLRGLRRRWSETGRPARELRDRRAVPAGRAGAVEPATRGRRTAWRRCAGPTRPPRRRSSTTST